MKDAPIVIEENRKAAGIASILLILAIILQAFHDIEHFAQMYQRIWLKLNPQMAGGILFFLNVEWNHYLFNTGYFIILILVFYFLISDSSLFHSLVKSGRGRIIMGSFIFGFVFQGYHVLEHTIRMGQYYLINCSPCPGILGHYFDLAYLHFTFNMITTIFPALLILLLWQKVKTYLFYKETSNITILRLTSIYIGITAIFVAISVLGFHLFWATKWLMSPSDISLVTLIVAALGVGVAAFFNPCVLPILPSYLVYQTEIVTSGGKTLYRGKLLRNGCYAALGLLASMAIFGLIIAALGETFINFIKPGTVTLDWFKRLMGLILIGLGFLLLKNRVFGTLNKVEQAGSRLLNAAGGNFRKFFLFGFGYILVGIGCVAPLVGGLAILALNGGGFLPALLVFFLASIAMAILMVSISIMAGFARESLTRILTMHIRMVRFLGGVLLMATGFFYIILSMSEYLHKVMP